MPLYNLRTRHTGGITFTSVDLPMKPKADAMICFDNPFDNCDNRYLGLIVAKVLHVEPCSKGSPREVVIGIASSTMGI